ncbi:hypothetical protein D9M70_434910 [compost metagenome]
MLLRADALEILGDHPELVAFDQRRPATDQAGAAAHLRIGERLEGDTVARRGNRSDDGNHTRMGTERRHDVFRLRAEAAARQP